MKPVPDTQPIVFRHAVPVQIRFNDLDLMGHINNATLQEYFDIGRMHYFMDLFEGKLFEDELALVIASYKTDFHFPVLLSHNVEVRTCITRLGNKSLDMRQQIRLVPDGAAVATSDSVMVCFHKETRTSAALPAAWKAVICRFEETGTAHDTV